MKNDIHPQYNDAIKASCACGNSWTTGSVLSEIQVEICSACHPFFTGKDKKVDRGGRLQRFANRAQKSQAKAATAMSKKKKRTAKDSKKKAAKAK